jgi:hypothetical protein
MNIERMASDVWEARDALPVDVWNELMAEFDGIITDPRAEWRAVYVDGSRRGFEVRFGEDVILQVRRPRYVDGRWAVWDIDCPESNWAYEGGAA